MSDKIGLIVDGDGDFASLKKRFRNGFKILKTDGPRGHAASERDIAQRSKKQIRILCAYNCNKIIVMMDFEQRNEHYNDFVKKIINAFLSINFGVPVYVSVPNRMIENWYLADINYLSKKKVFLRNNIKQKKFEGKHGKDEIKKCFKRGISYSETVHGPQLFAILRSDIARKNSNSFDKFLKLLETNDA